MFEKAITNDRRLSPWLVVFGACTLWLVLQNTMLMVVVVERDPRAVIAVADALLKAVNAVARQLWPFSLVGLGATLPLATWIVSRPEKRPVSPVEERS
jgi:hypothetical protein